MHNSINISLGKINLVINLVILFVLLINKTHQIPIPEEELLSENINNVENDLEILKQKVLNENSANSDGGDYDDRVENDEDNLNNINDLLKWIKNERTNTKLRTSDNLDETSKEDLFNFFKRDMALNQQHQSSGNHKKSVQYIIVPEESIKKKNANSNIKTFVIKSSQNPKNHIVIKYDPNSTSNSVKDDIRNLQRIIFSYGKRNLD